MQFLLGGGGTSTDLNDAFAATTPADKPVFTKVFGDSTSWRTKVGKLTLSFVFDPKAKYEHSAIMASAWNDPFDALREELRRHLLDEDDIAPIASQDEVVWDYIKSSVPPELLAKHLSSIDEYMDMLVNRAKKEYNELVAFTDAINKNAFDFAVKVAIDAYPVPKSKRGRERSPSADPDGGPVGVVTLHIRHELCEDDASSSSEQASSPTPDTLSPAVNGRQRSDSNASDTSVDFGSTNMLDLHLGNNVIVRDTKRVPRDAQELFSQMEAWFDATIKKRTNELVEAAGMTHSLYN